MENAYWQTDCIIGIVEGDLAQPHQLKIQFRSTLEKVDRINYSHRYSFDPFTFSLQNQSLPFTLFLFLTFISASSSAAQKFIFPIPNDVVFSNNLDSFKSWLHHLGEVAFQYLYSNWTNWKRSDLLYYIFWWIWIWIWKKYS